MCADGDRLTADTALGERKGFDGELEACGAVLFEGDNQVGKMTVCPGEAVFGIGPASANVCASFFITCAGLYYTFEKKCTQTYKCWVHFLFLAAGSTDVA